ncbi:MAG: PQQ-binding-like beta-propeller repeat protein [Pirellula sp.]
MSSSEIKTNDGQSPSVKPLRIWIPVLLVPLIGVTRYFPTWYPEITMVWAIGAFGPFLISFLMLLWWVLLSRATIRERITGFMGIIASLVLVGLLVDPTMQGPLFIVLTIPMCIVSFSIAAVFVSRLPVMKRTWIALLVGFLGAAFSLGLKNDGAWGDFSFGLSWRFRATPEETFLADKLEKSQASETTTRLPVLEPHGDFLSSWAGFRGNARDSVVRGVSFKKDWESSPPVEEWRRMVGPGWSSFAVSGNALLTLEQRGEEETVVCYEVSSGKQFWATPTLSRFFDGLGGLGPRGTPAIAGGNIYAFGAEGWLSKLDGATGKILWQVDVRTIANRKPPEWGYSGSPLVHGELVYVHAAGKEDKGLLAFETETGRLRWSAAVDDQSYSSPHVIKLFDREYLGMMTGRGLSLLELESGDVAMDYEFNTIGYRALQPAVIEDNKIIISNEVMGTRLVQVEMADGKLQAKEVWTSRNLKPDFNDLVVHKGFLYGYDGAILTCIDLTDGKRKWKGGRYGKGQMLLIADSNQIVVLSETGELVLLEAAPEKHTERFKIQAIDGKSWNHLAISGDRLFLRNAIEAVCYKLPLDNVASEVTE